jgi:hypothetical protein
MRVSHRHWLLATLALVGLARCDCSEQLQGLPTPQIAILDPQGAPHTAADPWLVVDIGDADTGQTASATLKLQNIGTGRLRINEMCFVVATDVATAIRPDTPCFTGAVPFVFTSAVGSSLAPEATVDVPVTFRPTTGGPASIFLRVASDAADEPLAAVQLTARGTDGALCAEPGVVDFGDVAVGANKTLTVRVTNCGIKPVTVDTLLLAENPDSAFSFTVNGAAPTTPLGPIEGGDGFDLEVTFTPANPVPYRDARRGSIRATTAAPFAAAYDLLLLGNGIEPPSCRLNIVPDVIDFGSVAANTTQTRPLIVQSVGQCACSLTGLAGPTPGDVGFSLPTPPALPILLKGTTGCADDPPAAASAPSTVTVTVAYTSPDRVTPAVDNATLEVSTDAPVDPVRTINLQANGGGTPFCQLEVTPEITNAIERGLGGQGRYGVVKFGRTAIFAEKRLPIVATNVGNATCTVSRVEYDQQRNTLANEFALEDAAGNNGITTTPITIAPGQSHTWFARFAPTETIQSDNPLDVFSFGSYSASLGTSALFCGLTGPNTRCNGIALVTDDTVTDMSESSGVDGRFSIGFSGTPVEPSVDIIPPELDFGLITLGCGSPEQRTTIYNTGATELVVGQPAIEPAANPATFVVVATSNPGDSPNDATSGWPFTIQPGNSLSVSVRYIARTQALETALLVVPTFEGGEEGPPVTIPVRGEGTLERQQTDIFDQARDPTVDVLFVVDDSGSMSAVQDQVAQNFPQFFTASNVAAANYHIAVTTTLTVDSSCIDLGGNATCADHDMSGHYTACGSDRFLTPTSSDPQGQFACNVRVTDTRRPSRPTSDGGEGGLRGAFNFLSAPKVNDPLINGGFLRDEAKLHVIIVSDEPDQSRGPTDLYIDFFRNLKGFRNEGLVAVSAVAKRDGETCASDDSNVGDGRYEDVVNALNGRFQSICDDDWSTTMRSLGLDSLGLQVEFFLSRPATESTIQVCVRNGSTTAACQPAQRTSSGAPNGWFYDATANSVVFNPGSVPARGSRVEVRYETFCFQP